MSSHAIPDPLMLTSTCVSRKNNVQLVCAKRQSGLPTTLVMRLRSPRWSSIPVSHTNSGRIMRPKTNINHCGFVLIELCQECTGTHTHTCKQTNSMREVTLIWVIRRSHLGKFSRGCYAEVYRLEGLSNKFIFSLIDFASMPNRGSLCFHVMFPPGRQTWWT